MILAVAVCLSRKAKTGRSRRLTRQPVADSAGFKLRDRP